MSATDYDWVIAPGETLAEYRQEQGVSAQTMAVRCMLEDERYARIEAGDEPITIDVAMRLAIGTGIKGRFWMALERAYRDGLAQGKTQ